MSPFNTLYARIINQKSKLRFDAPWIIMSSALGLKLFFFDFLIGRSPLSPPIEKAIAVLIPCAVLICQSFAFLFNARLRIGYQFASNFLLSILMFADILYIRYFGRPLSYWTLHQIGNLPWTAKSIMAISQFPDFLVFADIPIVAFVSIRFYQAKVRSNVNIFIACLCIGLVGYGMKLSANYKKHHFFLAPFTDKGNLFVFNPIGFHLIETIQSNIENKRHTLSEKEKSEIKSWFDLKKSYVTPETPFTKINNLGRGKNLVCIQIESMGAFVIKYRYKGKEITPFLNQLLDHGIYFPNYYCQNSGGGSSDAEFITFTSLYPISRGSAFSRFPHNFYKALPLLLREQSYATFAIHDNIAAFWNRGEAYPSLGIDHFMDNGAITRGGRVPNLSSDENLFHFAAQTLAHTPKPFFSLIITIDSHLAEKWSTKGIEDYFSAMSVVDRAVAILFDGLKKSNIYDSTVFVIYGDHAPPLNVNEIIKRSPEFAWISKGFGRIPFIIHSPSFMPVVINKKGGQIDALPTIAYIMGIKDSSGQNDRVMGRNLFSTKESFALGSSDDVDGSMKNEPFKQWLEDGPKISNLIISSNYFKQYQ